MNSFFLFRIEEKNHKGLNQQKCCGEIYLMNKLSSIFEKLIIINP